MVRIACTYAVSCLLKPLAHIILPYLKAHVVVSTTQRGSRRLNSVRHRGLRSRTVARRRDGELDGGELDARGSDEDVRVNFWDKKMNQIRSTLSERDGKHLQYIIHINTCHSHGSGEVPVCRANAWSS